MPRERVKTVDWLENNVNIPKRFSDFPGPYSRNNFPFQEGPLLAFDDPFVQEITMQWGTQLGKSLLLQLLILKIAATDPSPMMFIGPDKDSAREIANERLMPLAEAIPVLSKKLLPEIRRDSTKPDFRECVCYMAWSGSPASMGQKSCRYVFGTELSKWSHEKSLEADAGELARERVKAFFNHKIIFEGTPTIEGVCRIDNLGKTANQRLKYFVPCPHCIKYQILDFKKYLIFHKLPDGKLDADLAFQTAHYICHECEKKIEDRHKIGMIRQGIWAEAGIPKGFTERIYWTPGKERRRIHFDLSSLYSPLLSWGDIAAEFCRYFKSGQTLTLQNFYNSWLAETWSDTIKEYEPHEMKRLCIKDPRGYIPDWVYFLTMGIDVGKEYAVYIIRGWGHNGHSRLIDWGVKKHFSNCEQLIFNTRWKQKDNPMGQRILLCGIDSGYNTWDVYEWTNRMNNRYGEHVRAIKGQKYGAPYYCQIIERSGAEGKVVEGGIALWNISDQHWKSFLGTKFKTALDDPGAWELPKDVEVDQLYLKSICAEALKERTDRRGRKFYEWVVVDTETGNHYFDAEKIAAAMADMCGWKEIMEEKPIWKKPKQLKANDGEWLSGTENFTPGG